MKPRDVFSIAVRILGLVFVYQGLVAIPGVVANVFVMADKFSVMRLVYGIVAIAWPLILAYWLLGGAPLLMRIAYGRSDDGPGPVIP